MTVNAHLAHAKEYIAKGEDYYRKAAEEIKAAKSEDGLSNRAIAVVLGKNESWVRKLLKGLENAPAGGAVEVDWARTIPRDISAARQVARKRPAEMVDAIRRAPEPAKRQIMAALAETHETRQEMYEALSDNAGRRTEAADRRSREASPDLSAMGDELEAGHGMAKARRVLRSEVLPAIQRLDLSTAKGRKAQAALLEDLEELENAVGWVRSALEAADGSFDDELDRILSEEEAA